ncbi:MAG: cupin domain-containing protein [Microgenomates group bacterium]
MFSKTNLNDIQIEGTSHTSGSRKMIVSKDQTTSKYFEAMTYGYLPAGVKWEMHDHTNIIEICIVTKGNGIIKDAEGKIEEYKIGDRFIFPSNTKHEIENNSDSDSEFYLIRFQDQ